MKLLPLLLTSCLSRSYDLPENDCKPQIEAMEQACMEQNGTFKSTVLEARKCLGEDLRAVCSDLGIEGAVLSLSKSNKPY